MRKLPALIALSTVAVFALSACTNASEDSGNDSGATTSASSSPTFDPSTVKKDDAIAAMLPADVAKAGKITVGTNPQYAPAEFLDADGKTPIGYDMDLIRAVGAVLGVDVEIQSAEFASIIPAIGSKYDLGISAFTITAEREAQTTMISYFNAGQAFAVPKGNPDKIDPSDICGLTVAVQTGTVEDDGADQLSTQCQKDGKKPLEILKYSNQADATTNLVGGKADLMYADSPVVAYAVTQTGGKIEQLGDIFDSAPQGIAIAKSDTELANAVQAAVQKLMDDGTYDEIFGAWGNNAGAMKTAEINPSAS